MRPKASRGPVQLGLIGVGPLWEYRYRPALEKLGRRLKVRAVHDPVFSRAQAIAAELQAEPVAGLTALIQRPDIHALLLLDNPWYGEVPLQRICQTLKPAFIAGTLGTDLPALRQLHQQAEAEGLTIMAEFSRRHTPATSRLQELIATRLGRARRIEIEAVAPSPEDRQSFPGQLTGTDFLLGLLDWCRYVARRPPQSVFAHRQDEGCHVRVRFRQSTPAAEPATAEVRIRSRMAESDQDQPSIRQEVRCEHGQATLKGPLEIAWTNGTGTVAETLLSERSEVEVMLDQFCRRVVGGLVPVADIADVCHGLTLASAVERSLHEGNEVSLGSA